jgi:peptidoglycan hydrolase-like protein with peptidoglycan-binding domain
MSATERIGARVISETSEGSPPDDVSLVRRAQVLLNRIAGSGRLDEDGVLDGDTAEAVARFQETAELPSTGALDAATFAALEREAARAIAARAVLEEADDEGRGCVASGLPGGVDADAGVGLDAAGGVLGAPCLATADRVTVELALEDLTAVGGAFARDILVSAPARLEYIARVDEAAANILARVESGALTPAEGAAEAYAVRNAIRLSIRAATTPMTTAWAEAMACHRSLGELIERRSSELFGRPASTLSAAERDAVLTEVIRRSGGARLEATESIARWSAASRAVVIVAIALSVYRAVTADDVSLALGEEAAGWLGGMAGWAAGGYVGALACGEAAPICVGVVAIGGAVAGDLGSRVIFESAIEAVVVEEPVTP